MKNAAWFMALVVALVLAVAGCSKVGIAVNSSEMVAVPGGEYPMTGWASPVTQTVSPFLMGKYEVTYDLWRTVYKWAVENGYTIANPGREGINGIAGAVTTAAKYQPVAAVFWRDIIVWCNAYSEMNQLKPVYYADSKFTQPLKDSRGGKYPGSMDPAAGSIDNPYVNWNSDGYRLPTDLEWMYAAAYKDGKSWTPQDYPSGAAAAYNNKEAAVAVAWYNVNSGLKTYQVGGKKANALGIYDMSGNLWEWCFDLFAEFPRIPLKDYRGPEKGDARVLHGGCISGEAQYLRVGFRGNAKPYDTSHPEIGFRVARSVAVK